jgi:two-component system, response regulator RegA
VSGPARPLALVVDDDATYRNRLVRAFEGRAFRAHGAHDVDAALALARAEPPDYAVVDLRLPGGSGLEVLDGLKRLRADVNVVVLTGYGSIAVAVDAVHRGATNFVPKPADLDDLLVAFARGSHPPAARPAMEHDAPSLARAEWEHINRVLSDCGGNISQAARVLRIQRRSLQRKLAKYPVPRLARGRPQPGLRPRRAASTKVPPGTAAAAIASAAPRPLRRRVPNASSTAAT